MYVAPNSTSLKIKCVKEKCYEHSIYNIHSPI